MANEVRVASTTDEFAAVEAAADVSNKDLAAGLTAALPQEEVAEASSPVSDEVKVSSTTDEVEAVEAAAEEPEFKSKKLQKRFNKLTRRNHDLRDELSKAREEIENLRRGGRPAGEKPTEQPREEWREHEPAFAGEAEQRTNQEEEARRTELTQTKAREARDAESTIQQHQQHFEQLKAHHRQVMDQTIPKDQQTRQAFAETLARANAATGGQIRQAAAAAVMHAPNSVDLTVHLLQNPDDIKVLNSMPDEDAVGAVQWMSAVLLGERRARQVMAAGRRPALSKAPPPINPVRSSRNTDASLVDLSTADYQTYKKVRQQQEKRRYR